MYNNFAFDEGEIHQFLSKLFEQTSSIRKRADVFTILLVHDVPRDSALDLNYRKEHVGSTAIRNILEDYNPPLAVGGHIHESPGVDKIGETVVVNAGEGKYGRYAVITVKNGEIEVDLKGK